MDGRFRLSRATVAVTIFLSVLLLAISVGSLAAADETDSTDANAQEVVHEHDWPMYRNDPPTHNGYKPNARPPTSDITEAWSFNHGPNPTSPIIYDDRLYVTNDAGRVQGRVGSSGFLLWETYGARNPIGIVAVNGNILTATNDPDTDRPHMSDDMKFYIRRLDAVSGTVSGVTGGYHRNISTSLAVDEPYHYCYNYKEHGAAIDDDACLPQDGHYPEDEDTVTIGSAEYKITSENRDTTHLVAYREDSTAWEFDLGVDPDENPHSSAVTVADHVAFVWGDTNEYGSGIYAIDINTGELLWHHPTSEEITGEVVISDDNIYYTAGDSVYKLTGESAPVPTPEPTPRKTETPTETTEPTATPTLSPEPTATPEPTPVYEAPENSEAANETSNPNSEPTPTPIATPIPDTETPTPEVTPIPEPAEETNGQSPTPTPDSSINFPDTNPTSTPTPEATPTPEPAEETNGQLPVQTPDSPINFPDINSTSTPTPEATPVSGTPDTPSGQSPTPTPGSSINFPDTNPTSTSTPRPNSDQAPAQPEADSGITFPDPQADTPEADTTNTDSQETYPDYPAESPTEAPPTTPTHEAVTTESDVQTTETPVTDSAVNDIESDSSPPPSETTEKERATVNSTQSDNNAPITTDSMLDDQAGFGPIIALIAIVSSLLLAARAGNGGY